MLIILVAIYGLLGVIVGSFLNVLVLRSWSGMTLLGRSACLSCRRTLTAYELIPIVSWLFLRRRCAHCGVRISAHYPIVELSSGILFALLGLSGLAHSSVLLALALASGTIMIAIAAYDVRHTIIPDQWVYALAATTLLYGLLVGGYSIVAVAAGPLAALPLFLIWLLSGATMMGFGDVKLALSIGWLLGPIGGLVAVFGAFVIGAVISLAFLLPMPLYARLLRSSGIASFGSVTKQFTMKSEVPFGPFLILSACIVWITQVYGINPLTILGFL